METNKKTKIEEIKNCPFTSKCLIHLNTCSPSDATQCPEANKIKKLEKIPCPAMVNAGYDRTNLAICNCNIPQIRQCLPEGTSCFIEGKCIASYFDEETRNAVFHFNKSHPLELPNYHLKKIIPNVLRIHKKVQIATTGQKNYQ